MKCNVGGIDRKLRIVLGSIIVLAGIYFQSWWGLLGIMVVLTGIIRLCPAYLPFGFSTCEKPEK